MCNGAGGLLRTPEVLFTALDRLIASPYNVKSLQTFMSSGLAALLPTPEVLFTALDRLLANPYNVKSLQTFMSNGSVAALLPTPDVLFTALDRLIASPYNVKSLQGYMCDGIASKIGDDSERFFQTLTRIYTALGKGATSVVAGNGAFFSRLYTPGFLEHVFGIAAHFKSLRMDVTGAMCLVFKPNNNKLMDKVDALATKLHTVKTAVGMNSFIQRYKYDWRDKGRPHYNAALLALSNPVAVDESSESEHSDEEFTCDDPATSSS